MTLQRCQHDLISNNLGLNEAVDNMAQNHPLARDSHLSLCALGDACQTNTKLSSPVISLVLALELLEKN